jgi:UDPglucose 6-dehydrogenase
MSTTAFPTPESATPAPGTPGALTVGVVGLGYLGAVHAAGMAALGHRVVGYDVDPRKIDALQQARAPFFEPGLEDLLASTQGENLVFTHDVTDLKGADVVFVAVGTPQRKGELAADTSYVTAAVESLSAILPGPALIVGKSTVPVGTAAALAERLAETAPELEVAWNPEFLREGHAVDDTLHPDRLVFGVTSERAEALLRRVYARPIADDTPVVVTDLATAELVKVAANSFLATKISFINAMAEVAEAAGADVETLADAIGYDDRIGRKFLNAGLGFGGGCLPKDIRAFMARAGELGADQALTFLREVDSINLRRRSKVVELAREASGGSFVGRRIAVLGAAFKPHSDDIRDSPALNVAAQASLQGADVVVTDPAALDNAQAHWPDLSYAATAEEAITGADVVVLATEWPEYLALDPKALALIARGRTVIDARNALDPAAWQAAGWTYRGLGRRVADAGTTTAGTTPTRTTPTRTTSVRRAA